jgi:hypothetical protein
MAKVWMALEEEDLPIIQQVIDWFKARGIIEQTKSPGVTPTQAPNGIVAFAPAGGIPHANPATMTIYGALCNMFYEVDVSPGVKTLTRYTHPDGTDWEEYVFHLDPLDDVPAGKPLITFSSKWGTRYAIWESCNTWSTYSYYYD